MDPVNIPVASSIMDLTHVFPELGMLANAMGEEWVPGLDILVEKFLQEEIEEENHGKWWTLIKFAFTDSFNYKNNE